MFQLHVFDTFCHAIWISTKIPTISGVSIFSPKNRSMIDYTNPHNNENRLNPVSLKRYSGILRIHLDHCYGGGNHAAHPDRVAVGGIEFTRK